MTIVSESLKKLIDGSPDYELPSDCPYINLYGMYEYPTNKEEISMNENMVYLSSDAFYGSQLKNIDFTNAENLYLIDQTCFYGSQLKNIILPPNIEFLGEGVFQNCQQLKSLLIPSSLKHITNPFGASSGTKRTICIDKPTNSLGNVFWGTNDTIVIWNDNPAIFVKTKYDCDVYIKINGEYIEQRGIVGQEGDVVEIRIDKTGYDVYEFTFTLSDKLTIYDIDPVLEELGLYEKVIQNSGITSFSFDEDVTYLSDCCFLNCQDLKTLDFSRCTNLTYIGNYCFYGCTSLEEIDLSKCTKLTTLDDECFYNNVSLSKVILPNSITTLGDGCFYGCSNLKEMTIPDPVTSLGYRCFSSCSNLETMTLPNNLTYIDDWCFSYCSNLETITLPNNLTYMGNYCFYGCSNLKTITIPSSVTTIGGTSMFSDCTNLETIIINKPENSISGAPWGAPNAKVIWNG